METQGIKITGVQDGSLAYVEHDGSGCGLLDHAVIGDEKVRPAPNGGLFTEMVDGSGCGEVSAGEVDNYLTYVQRRAADQLPK